MSEKKVVTTLAAKARIGMVAQIGDQVGIIVDGTRKHVILDAGPLGEKTVKSALGPVELTKTQLFVGEWDSVTLLDVRPHRSVFLE